jgi:hypothetical protein
LLATRRLEEILLLRIYAYASYQERHVRKDSQACSSSSANSDQAIKYLIVTEELLILYNKNNAYAYLLLKTDFARAVHSYSFLSLEKNQTIKLESFSNRSLGVPACSPPGVLTFLESKSRKALWAGPVSPSRSSSSGFLSTNSNQRKEVGFSCSPAPPYLG